MVERDVRLDDEVIESADRARISIRHGRVEFAVEAVLASRHNKR
jgi:hypothetical protein